MKVSARSVTSPLMSTDTKEAAVLETPTDTPEPKKRKRGPRKRILGNGEGDYCIYEIAAADSGLPHGSLLPMPNLPRFETTQAAIRWIKTESGDLLTGKQIMILAAKEIMSIQTEVRPTVSITAKPKIAIGDPSKDA